MIVLTQGTRYSKIRLQLSAAKLVMPMTDDAILTRLEGGIFSIRLNQPKSRNALSVAMLNALDEALDQAEASPEVRVIVLSANGPAFCAGHDLKEMTAARNQADRGQAFFRETMALCSSVMQKIVHHRVPVIAEVDGIATAAGCQLVASCDLAVASEASKFATPGVQIGLFCSTPMVALSRNVSRKQAMEMLLTGEFVSAQEAVRIGLINRAVASEALQDETMRLANAITSKSAATIKIGKKAFYQQVEMPLEQAYQYASDVMVENMLKRDAEEGINAFIEKREPDWQDA